jgi:hypothetical protein
MNRVNFKKQKNLDKSNFFASNLLNKIRLFLENAIDRIRPSIDMFISLLTQIPCIMYLQLIHFGKGRLHYT